jgi:thymidylate synthase (FAD)
MIIIEPEVQVYPFNRKLTLKKIEQIGRTCYKSEDKITEDSASRFVSMLNNKGHRAMIEHASLSVKFICDRGVSHELVRHRLASFAQESTRYCNYGKNDDGVVFIRPFYLSPTSAEYGIWKNACEQSERSYLNLLTFARSPQEARAVLNNSVKTEIWITADLTEWHHIINMRADTPAHPQMKQLMIPLRNVLVDMIPEVFYDTLVDNVFSPDYYAKISWFKD